MDALVIEEGLLYCSQCGDSTDVTYMGTLGSLLWFRCRDCGWEWSVTVSEEEG